MSPESEVQSPDPEALKGRKLTAKGVSPGI